MRERLTERQNQVYEFIRAFIQENGKPPTLTEMGQALAIRSTNGVRKLVLALEKKGYIDRTPHESRGIALLDDEDDPFAFESGTPAIPLAARASSFEPTRLRSHRPTTMALDPRLLQGVNADNSLIVRAADDGMNGDGIRKGDFLLVEETRLQEIGNGTLVAALVGESMLIRRLDVANGRIHLRPADRTYSEETFPPQSPECYVVGRVRLVLRKL